MSLFMAMELRLGSTKPKSINLVPAPKHIQRSVAPVESRGGRVPPAPPALESLAFGSQGMDEDLWRPLPVDKLKLIQGKEMLEKLMFVMITTRCLLEKLQLIL